MNNKRDLIFLISVAIVVLFVAAFVSWQLNLFSIRYTESISGSTTQVSIDTRKSDRNWGKLISSSQISQGQIQIQTQQQDNQDSILSGVVSAPEPDSSMYLIPSEPAWNETVTLLEEALPIEANLCYLARKYNLVDETNSAELLRTEYHLGDEEKFWVLNTTEKIYSHRDFELVYITDHSYFWISDGVAFDPAAVQQLAETFESQIYPVDRQVFGEEDSPGYDQDEHIFILYADGLGGGIAGYFSSINSWDCFVNPYANGHEMFVMNADTISLLQLYTYGVAAHEFQHVIHYHQDPNEDSWVNEGASELAVILNDSITGSKELFFLMNPDIQLNRWVTTNEESTAHYGSSYLFFRYLFERFGQNFITSLVSNPQNGLTGLDATLISEEILNEQTGKIYKAEEIFRDWSLANYLTGINKSIEPWNYAGEIEFSEINPVETITSCSEKWVTRTVNQFGTDYIRIACPEPRQLVFEGAAEVSLLPVEIKSGDYAFWSNRGDESVMTLQKKFDFSHTEGNILLKYLTWFDLEAGFDYVYLNVSIDGETWETIQTPSGVDSNPSGRNYDWAYTSISSGWVEEEVDLSRYAGEEVFIQFEYITDSSINGEGFLLDAVRIDAIGYFEDFESGSRGWESTGFVRIQNSLPQSFNLSMITIDEENIEVGFLPLTNGNRTFYDLLPADEVYEYILVVSGTNRYSWIPGTYRYKFIDPE